MVDYLPLLKKLIIVESPAKAKTISRFLGKDYNVEASVGHIRDIPESASELPANVKKEKWPILGVDVYKDFEPIYIVPADKKKQVARLKEAMKDADAVLLATDEDREGESISWHILQVATPKKGAEVQRIVFHEITPEAIEGALRNPRGVDENLVRAQETRRILDRLFGYGLSPLLWRVVKPGLSAGRVQSVAVRLTVERERQRMRFKQATYWDLKAELEAEAGKFAASLTRIDDAPLADGKAFDDETGELKNKKMRLLDETGAKDLRQTAEEARPWTVTKLSQTPGEQKPHPPFTTSTLQQEANRKLRFPAKKTMRAAQDLYEGVDLAGERVGLITYMRTDSTTLSERALSQARELITEMYGGEYLPDNPIRYKTKSKGAQEAHEAIRPTDLSRLPKDVKPYLSDDQFKLYELIWKRTVASQMKPAKVLRTNVEVTVENLVFSASGKQILFPGFLRAYVEGSDDPEAELEDKEVLLPRLAEGEEVKPLSVTAESHTTKPPARYTEASLVKKLEEEGIGRPSTYAGIIGTIQDRGYVFKRSNELIPTFTAFAVTELLEKRFPDLVDLKFTAHLEDELDDIASGELQWKEPLREFYFGKNDDGLDKRVDIERNRQEYPSIPLGDGVVVKIGKYGAYVQQGDGDERKSASIPENTAPAELTYERALELLEKTTSEPEVLATDDDGHAITLKTGRFGDYLQVSAGDGEKPRNINLPKELSTDQVTAGIALALASLPRTLGTSEGEEVTAGIGKFGPFVKRGSEYRNLDGWRKATEITLEEALELLAQPKGSSRAPAVIKSINGYEVKSGKYGPYVTDGEINATLPRGTVPEDLTAEEARTLIENKRAAGPAKKRTFRRKKT